MSAGFRGAARVRRVRRLLWAGAMECLCNWRTVEGGPVVWWRREVAWV